jgi:hypothetical protein
MARQFLTGLNLNKNELLNARIQNLANDPSNPVLGQIYFNTSANELRVYNGEEFEAVGLNGVTASASEINILDGALIDTDELNTLAGSDTTTTIQAQLDLKATSDEPVFSGDVTIDADIIFEGTEYTTTLEFTDPSEDRNILFPDASGTVILSSNTVNALAAPSASFSMNSQKIVSLADPVDPQDAATKAYVDAARSGLDVKQSVRVATTAEITLSGTQTIDGVAVVEGDRVLVKNQSVLSDNGIYVVDEDAWFRAEDADSDAEVTAGMFTFVEEGTANSDSGWVLTTNNPITVGVSALTFAQFSGAGQITAGNGLTKTGNTIDAVGTADRITVNADSIDIASTYVGQTSITTLGTITTGTWNGTDIAVADGGTGASTAAGAKENLGFMTRYSETNDLLSDTSGVVTWSVVHNLGTRDVLVQVYDTATYAQVEVDVDRTSNSTVTLSWVSVDDVPAGAYKAVVIG